MIFLITCPAKIERNMEKIVYKPNPHIAFPLGFGDMKSQSAIADLFLEDKKVCLSIRIDAIGYDDYTKKQVERGGSIEKVFPGITKSMGRLPDINAFWLYSVTIFTTRTASHQSLLVLPTNDEEIKVEWFDDFHEVLNFCAKEYGIQSSHFKKFSSNKKIK